MPNILSQENTIELTTIFNQFINRTQEKLNRIDMLHDHLENKFDQELFLELHNIVHTLKGSCATFGYLALGEMAKEIDKLIIICIQQEENYNDTLSCITSLKSIFFETSKEVAFSRFLLINLNPEEKS